MSGESLNLKTLQSHVIKTIVGSIASALVLSLIVGIGFYWKTNDTLGRLTDEQAKTTVIVEKHSEQLSKNNQDNSVSDVQIKNLELRMGSIEKTQQDMLRVLIEINTSQKMLVRNSK